MKREKYTLNDLKMIFETIKKEEEDSNNITIKGNIFTKVEYYKSDILKKKLKLAHPLTSLKYLTAPLHLGGWYDSNEKELVILINRMYEYMDTIPSDSFAQILMMIYHEIRHRYQEQKDKDFKIYSNFLIDMEKVIVKNDYTYYKINHDYFLLEIDADQNAVQKTTKYIKENTNLYDESKDYINNYLENVERRLDVYNPQEIFERFNNILQEKIKKNSEKTCYSLEDIIIEIYPNIDSVESRNMKTILPYIYNEDGTFKSIKEILSIKKEIDIKILYLVLGSIPFIKSIDFKTLDKTELQYMVYILEDLYQQEYRRLERINMIKEEEISLLEYKIYNEKGIIKKLDNITILINTLINELSDKIDDGNRQTFYNKILPILLDETIKNKTKKQKKKSK